MLSVETNDNAKKRIMNFIPNELGINLCSVEDIDIKRQDDGQIEYILIRFIPNNHKEENNELLPNQNRNQ